MKGRPAGRGAEAGAPGDRRPRMRPPRWLVALVFLLSAPEASARGGPLLRVDFIAVGQGDATLVTSTTGKTVLIDGGPRGAADDLVAFLRGRGAGPIDLLLLTHPHADHLGGLAAVVRRRGARLFLDAPAPHPSPAYRALLRTLEARKVPVRTAERGRAVELGGGARLVLLGPPAPPIVGSRSDVNSNSVVARLDHGEVRVLFAGDAEAVTEKALLARGDDIGALVLKVAHHGSRHSSGAAFLAAVRPRVAAISCGGENDYGHPAPATLARLARLGVEVFRTDLDGTITLWSDGKKVEVQTESGRRKVLRARRGR